jgi:hypothetical protein
VGCVVDVDQLQSIQYLGAAAAVRRPLPPILVFSRGAELDDVTWTPGVCLLGLGLYRV